MTQITETIGEIGEAAPAVSLPEPASGESAQDGSHACLNCDTMLVGSHCHACGQAAHVHRTLDAFFHDLLHGVFHFEGRIWRTVPALLLRPGQLTREYIDGRRATYVSPVALFLFSVFLMFAVIRQFSGGTMPAPGWQVTGDLSAGIAETSGSLAALEAERARRARTGTPTGDIDGEIAGERRTLDLLRELQAGGADQPGNYSDIPAIDSAITAIRANPQLALYKLQSYAYKYSWALIPISVPFLWLLFPFSRRFGLYDHTVFVTYSLAFMTILVSALTLADAAGLPWIGFAIAIAPPWHMHRQLRGTYGLDGRQALWRTVALTIFALAALALFALLILAQAGG